ncbi:MAG: tetratricopeptide repeat protein [Verrucomicrobia bacterium]|jgi:cellulose synthase operon protein C|nr:tetratricopeptide repeat protein [Verrucomicrobiota bacterium]MBT7065060.1 tetratricopeptide repeat protein [Verrucomicrobiota bacterium]MBT7699587.1 tetratricopeptide repeat protein [Verrucomicrobiota bacterium]
MRGFRFAAVVLGVCGLLADLVLPAAVAAKPAAEAPQADPAEELYFSANALYNRRLYELSAREYRTFLKDYSRHKRKAKAELGLALSLYALGDYAAAEPLLAKAAKVGKDEMAQQVAVLRGQSLLKLKRAAEAEKVYLAATRTNKGRALADAWVGLTEARFQQEKWSDVMSAAAAMLKAAPTHPHAARVRFQDGLARYRLDKFAEAATVLEKLKTVKQAPLLVHQARFLLAECRRELGELDKAAAEYTAAAADSEGAFAAEARFRLGFVRFAQKRYDDAIKELKAYLAANATAPLAPRASLTLGQAYLEKKAYKEAEATLTPLATAAKPDVEAVTWLARTYSRQQRMADAAKVLERGVPHAAKTPQLPGMLFDLGHAQLALEQYAPAATAFTRITAEFAAWEQTAEAAYLAALARHRGGDYAGSLTACTTFPGKHPTHTRLPDAAFMRAENLLLLTRDAEALKAYEGFLAAHAKHTSVQAASFRLVQLQHKQQAWQAALDRAIPLVASTAATAGKPEGALFAPLPFLVGDCYFNIEKWADAITHLKTFVDKQPTATHRDVALLKLGLAYSHLGKTAEAVKSLSALASAYPKSAQRSVGLVELGRLQYEAKQYAPARTSFQGVSATATASDASRAQAAYYLGWIALAEQKDADAATHFTTVIQKHAASPLVADSLLQLGSVQLKTKSYPAAAITLTRLVKEFPPYEKADHALYSLGVSMARQEQWAAAGTHFTALVKKHAASALRDRALYEGAWCAKRQEQPEAAMQQYSDLLRDFPQSELAARAAFELAELEFEAARYAEAIQRLDKLLPLIKDKDLKEQALYRLAWCHFNKEDAARAAVTFEKLLAEFPKTRFLAHAAFQAGEARMQLKEHPAARTHFAKAAALPNEKEVHELALLRLGETCALTQQWPQAEQAYQALLKTYAQGEWARRAQLGLGWARENQRKYAPAIEAYTTVVRGTQRDETAARCQFQIGECLFALNKHDEAIQALVKVSVAYGYPQWSAKALLETGRVLEKQDKRDHAREQYEEVVKTYADSDAATVARERLQALGTGE